METALFTGAVALALVACASPDAADLTGTWRLTTISETPVLPGRGPRLTLADGRVGGGTGCNAYSGSYELEGSHLTITNQEMTIAACLDLLFNEQEDKYLRALFGRSRVSFSGNLMTLTRDDGTKLVFVRERNEP